MWFKGRIALALAFAVAAIWLTASGIGSDIITATIAAMPSRSFVGHAPSIYQGQASLQERIIAADVVARVRLNFVQAVTESIVPQGICKCP